MFQRFFVPLDGSARAEKAIPVAAKLARNTSGTLVLTRVIVPVAVEGNASNIIANEARIVQDKEVSEARLYLDEISKRYKQVLDGLHLVLEALPTNDMISSTLLSTACQEHADLIVMCSRGESRIKRWLFGSIAQNMIRRSPLPVLVLNDHAKAVSLEDTSHPLHILVTLDGSAFSEAILPSISQLLTLFPTTTPHRLHLLRVVIDPPALGTFGSEAYAIALQQKEEIQRAEVYLQGIAHKLASETGFIVTMSVVTRSDPAAVILQLAHSTSSEQGEGIQDVEYDLVAMATHGRSGVRRVLLGSVTEKVFGATTLPLFVICPAPEEEKQLVEEKTSRALEKAATTGWSGLL